jgi:hypothetical protein
LTSIVAEMHLLTHMPMALNLCVKEETISSTL